MKEKITERPPMQLDTYHAVGTSHSQCIAYRKHLYRRFGALINLLPIQAASP